MLEMYVGKLPITGSEGVGNLCYTKRQLLLLKE